MKFKKEIALLIIAIALFVSSSLMYSQEVGNQSRMRYTIDEATTGAAFPYQTYAVSAMGFGSILIVIASLSYQKRSKQLETVVN